jgi:hypothetical protein
VLVSDRGDGSSFIFQSERRHKNIFPFPPSPAEKIGYVLPYRLYIYVLQKWLTLPIQNANTFATTNHVLAE